MAEQRMKRCRDPEHVGPNPLPANEGYFYGTTSRGKTHNQWGERYLRSICRACKRRKNREYSKRVKRRTTPQERERYRVMARARDRAYQRLAAMNEEGFKVLYAEELLKHGIRLDKYMGPLPREEKMSDRDERRSRRHGTV